MAVKELPLKGLKPLQQGHAGAADAYYQASARNKASQSQATLVVRLPVRGEIETADKLILSKAVAEEVVTVYYSRLLEDAIGVQPHAPAIKAASEAVGITVDNVQGHLRVLGGSLQVAGIASWPNTPPGLPSDQLQLVSTLQPICQLEENIQCSTADATGARRFLQASLQQDDTDSFARYVQLYSYPYCKQRTLRKATTADKQTAVDTARATVSRHQGNIDGVICNTHPRRRCAQAPTAILADSTAGDVMAAIGSTPRATAAAAAGGPAVHRVVCFSPDVHDKGLSPDQLLELSQELSATPRLVHLHQARFAAQMASELMSNHQPELSRWGLTADDVSAVATLLSTPAVTRLALTLIHYLHTRYISNSSCVTLQLAQRIQAQAQVDRRTKLVTTGQRPNATPAANTAWGSAGGSSALPTPAAAVGMDEYDSTFKWDMGCQLLLERKAEAAAETIKKCTAATAAAAQQTAQRQSLLPCQLNNGCKRLGTAAPIGAFSTAGPGESRLSAETDPAATGLSLSGSCSRVRPVRSVRSLQRQESTYSDSSKSKHSVASSVHSYTQALDAAQYQSQLLAGATTQELQSCRISSVLQAWDDLVSTLRRSPHGVTFAVPTLLLSLQVLVHKVFSAALPTWSLTKQGTAALQQVTAAPRQLLDPQQCYNTLMVLAGRPTAIAVRQMCDAGPVALAERRSRRLKPGIVVAAAVGPQPGSPTTRRMLHAAAYKRADSGSEIEPVFLGADSLHAAAAHKMTKVLQCGG